MKNFPRPKNSEELTRFVGLAGYYRGLLPDFATRAQALQKLAAKPRRFSWEAHHQTAFHELKRMFSDDLCRVMPDPEAAFIVKTDANLLCVQAVLQIQQGKQVVLEYASKAFTKTEK